MTRKSGVAKGAAVGSGKITADLYDVRLAMRKRVRKTDKGTLLVDTDPQQADEEEGVRLVRRARKYEKQGEAVIEDFVRGSAVLGKHSYGEKLEQLQLDLMDLEMGRKVFGTPRDFGEVPEWTALLAKLKRSVRA